MIRNHCLWHMPYDGGLYTDAEANHLAYGYA